MLVSCGALCKSALQTITPGHIFHTVRGQNTCLESPFCRRCGKPVAESSYFKVLVSTGRTCTLHEGDLGYFSPKECIQAGSRSESPQVFLKVFLNKHTSNTCLHAFVTQVAKRTMPCSNRALHHEDLFLLSFPPSRPVGVVLSPSQLEISGSTTFHSVDSEHTQSWKENWSPSSSTFTASCLLLMTTRSSSVSGALAGGPCTTLSSGVFPLATCPAWAAMPCAFLCCEFSLVKHLTVKKQTHKIIRRVVGRREKRIWKAVI